MKLHEAIQKDAGIICSNISEREKVLEILISKGMKEFMPTEFKDTDLSIGFFASQPNTYSVTRIIEWVDLFEITA